MQSRLCSQEGSPADTITQQQATTRSLIKMQSIIAQHLEIDNIHDPLLAINFARWATPTFKWNLYVVSNKLWILSGVYLMCLYMGFQAVLGAEGLPRAFFWRRIHRGPLISVCNLPNIWTHPALVSLPSHWKEVHWVLWKPNEDSEKGLQVSARGQHL